MLALCFLWSASNFILRVRRLNENKLYPTGLPTLRTLSEINKNVSALYPVFCGAPFSWNSKNTWESSSFFPWFVCKKIIIFLHTFIRFVAWHLSFMMFLLKLKSPWNVDYILREIQHKTFNQAVCKDNPAPVLFIVSPFSWLFSSLKH